MGTQGEIPPRDPITITDLAGKTVIEEILRGVEGVQTFNIDMSQQNAGVYLMNVSGKIGLQTFKVMKY